MKYLKLIILAFLFTNSIVAQKPQIGKITAVTEKRVTLKLETVPSNVKPKSVAFVSKDLTGVKGPLGITFSSGWLDIGKVEVISISNNILLLEIINEKTDIVKNGEVQKQFLVGNRIKLEWSK